MKNLLMMTLLGCAVFPTFAQIVSVKSPDGKNEIRLLTDPVLSYEVLRGGELCVATTPIGMSIEGKATFGGKGMQVVASETITHSETIKTPIYKKAYVLDDGNETVVTFTDGWKVRMHARNDGVAYRIESGIKGRVRVLSEAAGFTLPAEKSEVSAAYHFGGWNGDHFQNSWESIYVTTNAMALKTNELIYLPFVARTARGTVMCVTESDLRDYAGWNVMRTKGATFQGCFAKVPLKTINTNWGSTSQDKPARYKRITERASYIAETDGTRTFPWRVFILADAPSELVESDIVYALAAPSKIADSSWIKPGKVAWDWWNDWNVSGVDFRAGCNTKTYEYYIDFAAEKGIEYVIFDEGWSKHLQIMEFNPEVDVPRLVAYANKRGVGIVLWCAWAQLDGCQHAVFSHYSRMGVKGFKIDFMDRDDQVVERFLEETASVAAEYKLLLDYHGMHKPTGLHRTYPNILNYEGVHGLEQCKWMKTEGMPQNDLTCYFARMTAGPMDYTPGAMRNSAKGQWAPNTQLPGSQGTRVHQMALMTLFEAPLQMLCDSPTQYRHNEECFNFMAEVPVVWDEVKGLSGDICSHALVARRKGEVWYVAGICNWKEFKTTLDTSFLAAGKWRMEIFADGINADRDGTDYKYTTRTIEAGEKIEIKMMPGGGWTAKIRPAKPWWKLDF